jgi:hypothetical protein
MKFRARDRRTALLAIACGAFTLGACEPFDPCPETKKQERVGQLDDFWNLERIQASGLPNSPLPFPPTVLGGGTVLPQLLEGDLRFLTQFADKGSSCTQLIRTRGTVTANYRYTWQFETQGDWQIGVFHYDHKTRVVTLKAYGQSVTGTVNETGDEMRFSIPASRFKKEYEQYGTLFVRFTKSPF